MRRWSERGESQMGCLFGVVILLIGLLIAYKMIPVKVKAAEMRDIVQDEARAAGTRTDARIRDNILAKAQQLNITLTKDEVKIVRVAGTITVDVNYVVPVTFPGYTYNWAFHHRAENPIF